MLCVCAWACDSCPTTRPQNQFNMKIMETVSTPSPNSLQIQLHSSSKTHSIPPFTKHHAIPCASCRSIRSGAAWCSSSTMRSHLPAQSWTKVTFHVEKKTAFLAIRIAISIGKISEKSDLYGFKNFQTLSFRRKNWMFHDLEPMELSF